MGILRMIGFPSLSNLDYVPYQQPRKSPPNVISFNAAISACEKQRRWQVALFLLSEMASDRVVPDQISFNASISACEKGSDWVAVKELTLTYYIGGSPVNMYIYIYIYQF